MYLVLVAATFISCTSAEALGTSHPYSPAGCKTTEQHKFDISLSNITNPTLHLQVDPDGSLLSLNEGRLTDAQGRVAYVDHTHQFRFGLKDHHIGIEFNPAWSLCPNDSLALGSNALFYECLTGNSRSLCDKSISSECTPTFILATLVESNTSYKRPYITSVHADSNTITAAKNIGLVASASNSSSPAATSASKISSSRIITSLFVTNGTNNGTVPTNTTANGDDASSNHIHWSSLLILCFAVAVAAAIYKAIRAYWGPPVQATGDSPAVGGS